MEAIKLAVLISLGVVLGVTILLLARSTPRHRVPLRTRRQSAAAPQIAGDNNGPSSSRDHIGKIRSIERRVTLLYFVVVPGAAYILLRSEARSFIFAHPFWSVLLAAICIGLMVILHHAVLWERILRSHWLLKQLSWGGCDAMDFFGRRSDALKELERRGLSRDEIIASSIGSLGSKRQSDRTAAMHTLGCCADEAAIHPLVQLLTRQDKGFAMADVVRSIRNVHQHLNRPADTQTEKAMIDAFGTQIKGGWRSASILRDIESISESGALIPLLTRLLDSPDAALRQEAGGMLIRKGNPTGTEQARRKVVQPLLKHLLNTLQDVVRKMREGHRFTHETWSDSEGGSGESGDWVEVLNELRRTSGQLGALGDASILPVLRQAPALVPRTVSVQSTGGFRKSSPTVQDNEMRKPIEDLIQRLARSSPGGTKEPR